jgi:hypothetical protein
MLMVDFNNQATVATPAADVARILILQRRNDFIEAKESFRKANLAHDVEDRSVVRARLESFWDEVEAAYFRSEGEKAWQLFHQSIQDADTNDAIRDCFHTLNHWLDQKRLIRIDTKKQYDTTMVTDDDEANNL